MNFVNSLAGGMCKWVIGLFQLSMYTRAGEFSIMFECMYLAIPVEIHTPLCRRHQKCCKQERVMVTRKKHLIRVFFFYHQAYYLCIVFSCFQVSTVNIDSLFRESVDSKIFTTGLGQNWSRNDTMGVFCCRGGILVQGMFQKSVVMHCCLQYLM